MTPVHTGDRRSSPIDHSDCCSPSPASGIPAEQWRQHCAADAEQSREEKRRSRSRCDRRSGGAVPAAESLVLPADSLAVAGFASPAHPPLTASHSHSQPWRPNLTRISSRILRDSAINSSRTRTSSRCCSDYSVRMCSLRCSRTSRDSDSQCTGRTQKGRKGGS